MQKSQLILWYPFINLSGFCIPPIPKILRLCFQSCPRSMQACPPLCRLSAKPMPNAFPKAKIQAILPLSIPQPHLIFLPILSQNTIPIFRFLFTISFKKPKKKKKNFHNSQADDISAVSFFNIFQFCQKKLLKFFLRCITIYL